MYKGLFSPILKFYSSAKKPTPQLPANLITPHLLQQAPQLVQPRAPTLPSVTFVNNNHRIAFIHTY